MSGRWTHRPFEDCIEPVERTRKVQRKRFCDTGEHPIVSQEAGLINGYWDDGTDLLKVSTPVIVFGDHTRVLKYVDFDFVVGADGVRILKPRNFLAPKFFFYQLEAAEIPSLGYSRHYRLLRNLDIAVPPLPEQRRIVGVLDEAFAGLATAKANAEKNLQNARALFERHLLSEVLGLAEKWGTEPLDSLCELFVDSPHRTPRYSEDGLPALRPRDVVNGRLDLAHARRVSAVEYAVQTKRHKPAPGDIIYSRELSYGWAAVLPREPLVCLSQGMCLFRPDARLDAEFMVDVLNSPFGREQSTRAAVGAAHPHINLGEIKSFAIPFPPLAEQRRAVKEIDELSNETQRLADIYQRKLTALDALKESLLHQAFTGQLSAAA
jgi:type I restriction enzyme S subunit